MKAVRLYEYGPAKNLKYETDVPDPEMGENDVLIAVAAISINPIDWKVRSGEAKERFPLSFPAILGRDVSGVVRAVGSNTRGVQIGDRVMAFNNRGNIYAELVAMPASEVTHIPDGVDIIHAAALPLIAVTGDQLVREACALQPGQSVLVTGALGSVGRAAVHSAKKMGAHVIAGVRKHSLEEAKTLGANAVIAIDDEEALKKLGQLDAIADTVGGETATKLLVHIREGGVCGTVVMPMPDGSLHPKIRVIRQQAHANPSKVREFADDFRDGKFILPIVRSFSLSEAAEAQEFAQKGSSGGKVLLLVV